MRLLTAKQVAERFNLSPSWVRDHSTRKKPLLPSVKFGKARSKAARRYEEDEVTKFISQLRENGL